MKSTPEEIAQKIINDHRWGMSELFLRETCDKLQEAISDAIKLERENDISKSEP
jgi:hypothetical protein